MKSPFPEVEMLLEKYETEPEHVTHVAALTLQLFDQLAFWHQLNERDRLLLQASALLHDIGWSQTTDGKGHHKESLRLIDLFPWQSVDPREKELLAQCARYHRKSIPSSEHPRFTALLPDDRLRLQKIASLLRIGDALDRTHRQLIRRIEVRALDQEWFFMLDSDSKLDSEIKMAENKSDLLQIISGKRLVFTANDI